MLNLVYVRIRILGYKALIDSSTPLRWHKYLGHKYHPHYSEITLRYLTGQAPMAQAMVQAWAQVTKNKGKILRRRFVGNFVDGGVI